MSAAVRGSRRQNQNLVSPQLSIRCPRPLCRRRRRRCNQQTLL